MTTDSFPTDIRENWEIREWRHATAVLSKEFPDEFDDLVGVLRNFKLLKSQIMTPGGNKSPIAHALDGAFAEKGWVEKQFDVRILADGDEYKSVTHHVDYYKNRVAIETEWNNKDPFYHRDITNFRLLFESRVISVGIVITRGDSLQQIFNDLGRGSSYGPSTTHIGKLLPIMEGDNVGGCPVLAFGISQKLYDPNY